MCCGVATAPLPPTGSSVHPAGTCSPCYVSACRHRHVRGNAAPPVLPVLKQPEPPTGRPYDRGRYHDEADGACWRAFYGSDGANLAVVTFICDWHRRDEERADVESIIQSLRFTP